MSIWTNHVSGAERHVWPAALSAALSFVTRFEEEPPLSWLSQLGCKLPLCKNSTKHQVTLKPRPANLAKALAQGGIHSPGGLCPGFSQIPLQCCDLVLCLLAQSHGMQPEERIPLSVTTCGLPVLPAASE